jgi:hypothetical protein
MAAQGIVGGLASMPLGLMQVSVAGTQVMHRPTASFLRQIANAVGSALPGAVAMAGGGPHAGIELTIASNKATLRSIFAFPSVELTNWKIA